MGVRSAFDPLQLGLFAPPPPTLGGGVRLALPGADVVYWERWLPPAEAGPLFEALLAGTRWRQSRRLMYGRWVDVPRQQGVYADERVLRRQDKERSSASSAAGVALASESEQLLEGRLREVRDRLGAACEADFPWVLANLYRDGRDSVAMHADDEEDLGPRPVIASLSLGATRRFLFKPKPGRPGEAIALDLPTGALLVMAGATQRHWEHAVPKVARAVGPRINLTFRTKDGFPWLVKDDLPQV